MGAKEALNKYGFKQEKMYLHRTATDKEPTDFPKPDRSFRINFESYNLSLEETYFFMLTHLSQDWGLHKTIKVKDIFTSSEQSAFWGQSANRLNLQQGQAQNYLALIGKFTRELFPIVRELRILKEKLGYYELSIKKKNKPADIALKDVWIGLVEGGGKNPGSVLGLSTQLGFATLPDLFYNTFVTSKSEIDSKVESLKFNEKVKEVLKRKLFSYLQWRDETYGELATRQKFMMKFLKQHYTVIKLYMNWLKPVLKNVARLSSNPEKSDSVDLISAFEGAALEAEFLTYRPFPGETDTYNACVLVTFDYRLRPEMNYHQDGYQHKGPIHVGKVAISLRSYVWTDKQIKKYMSMRDDEAMEMIGSVDETVKAELDALGDEVKEFLEEGGEEIDKKEEVVIKKPKLPGMADPFIGVVKGFGSILGPLKFSSNKKDKKETIKDGIVQKKAKDAAKMAIWQAFKNYKKAHGMLSW